MVLQKQKETCNQEGRKSINERWKKETERKKEERG